MMKSLCQFIAAIFLINLASCAWLVSSDNDENDLLSRIESNWFSIDPKIQLADYQGEIQPHLFFDPQSNFSLKSPQVNYIPLVVPGDKRAFAIDVPSGQRYFSHLHCSQNDVWKERSTVPADPIYVRGVIPRTFDQINDPLQIIVLGSKGIDHTSAKFYQAHIMSAYVEQICPVGKCSLPGDWLNRMVLVAVDSRRQDLTQLKDLQSFQEKVEWKLVRAQLENHFGRNRSSDEEFPAVRVGQLLPLNDALSYLNSRTVRLTNVELVKLHRSCLSVYNKLWDEVGVETMFDREAQTSQEIKEYQIILETLRKQKKPAFFNERLAAFLRRYGNEMATCSRLVYPGNPTTDPERYNFVAWIGFLARLHKEGWEFDCRIGHWNNENIGSRAMKNFEKFTCTNKFIDQAIDEIPLLLKTIRATKGEHWRYVNWDEEAQGAHSKIFGWVKVPDRYFACSNDLNEKIRGAWKQKNEFQTWKRRSNVKNLTEAGYIY